jgi:CDP-glucose 4,6-dehydratase
MGFRRPTVEVMELSPTFWEGRRVLITGGTGFKGSWACLWLSQLGAEVIAYSKGVPTAPSLFDGARVAEDVEVVEGDIRDRDDLVAVVRDRAPEVIIHMAAQPLVRRSYDDPAGTYEVNVMGTVNVLEAARLSDSVQAVLNVTTDKVYENREWLWGYREDEALGGYDPYSNSKASSELVTAAYRRSFFGEGSASIATARSGNVIGGGDWAEDRLIPDIVRGALAGETVHIRNPRAVRPWQHVLNPLSGYLLLCERMWESSSFDEGWNFGPDDHDVKPVGWIAERLDAAFDGGVDWQVDEGEHAHEANYLKLDSSKAKALLGWQPVWELDRALASIARWYNAIRAGEDLRALALSEIEAFQADAAGSPPVSAR